MSSVATCVEVKAGTYACMYIKDDKALNGQGFPTLGTNSDDSTRL